MRRIVTAALAAAGMFAATSASAATMLSTVNYGGKTYTLWYEGGGISWDGARAAAQLLGGDLVSIASAAENAAVYSLINGFGTYSEGLGGQLYWADSANQLGPWIGGYRVTPGVNIFAWSDGTAWSYTNWGSGEPSNYGGNENHLQLFANGTAAITGTDGRGSTWNDVGPNPNGPNPVYGYITEVAAVPEPGTWAMMIGGFGIIGGAMRRRARVELKTA